jgi:hypothetical protein
MLVFSGLWSQCDKEGRFPWKPRQLHLDILPFVQFDMEKTLNILAEHKLIARYEHEGGDFGLVPNFKKHQRVCGKEAEAPARFPAPHNSQVKQSGSIGEATGKQPRSTEKLSGAPEYGVRSTEYGVLTTENGARSPESRTTEDGARRTGNGIRGTEGQAAEKLSTVVENGPRKTGTDERKTDAAPLASGFAAVGDIVASAVEKAGKGKVKSGASPTNGETLPSVSVMPALTYTPAPQRRLVPADGIQDYLDSLPNGDPWSIIVEKLLKQVTSRSASQVLRGAKFEGVDGKTLLVRLPAHSAVPIVTRWSSLMLSTMAQFKMPFEQIDYCWPAEASA